MQGPSALGCSPAVEGAFVLGEYNVASTVVAGLAPLRAGFGGVAVGRFAWANPAGVVFNQRNSGHDVLGLVLPRIGPDVDWRSVYYDEPTKTWRIREGLPVTLLATGNVQVRLADGGYANQPIYANTLDGSANAGYIPAGELTRWSMVNNCPPGQLGIISTWSNPS